MNTTARFDMFVQTHTSHIPLYKVHSMAFPLEFAAHPRLSANESLTSPSSPRLKRCTSPNQSSGRLLICKIDATE